MGTSAPSPRSSRPAPASIGRRRHTFPHLRPGPLQPVTDLPPAGDTDQLDNDADPYHPLLALGVLHVRRAIPPVGALLGGLAGDPPRCCGPAGRAGLRPGPATPAPWRPGPAWSPRRLRLVGGRDLGHGLSLLLDGLAQSDGESVGILGRTAEMRTIKAAEGGSLGTEGGCVTGCFVDIMEAAKNQGLGPRTAPGGSWGGGCKRGRPG